MSVEISLPSHSSNVGVGYGVAVCCQAGVGVDTGASVGRGVARGFLVGVGIAATVAATCVAAALGVDEMFRQKKSALYGGSLLTFWYIRVLLEFPHSP